MSEVPQGPAVAKPTRPPGDYEYVPPPASTASRWSGWLTFAGITLTIVGVIHLIAGLVALLEPEDYLVTSGGLVFQLDYTTWGWLHLGLGIVGLLTGVGVLNRRPWARAGAVAFCTLSILVNVGFLAAMPVWAVTVIAFDVLFIYAVVVHGDEGA